MYESTAIVNKNLVLRPKDINSILTNYRIKLIREKDDVGDEIVEVFGKLIRTVPKYEPLNQLNSTYFSAEYCPRNTSTPTVILTPFIFQMREDKFLPIYYVDRKEFVWGEKLEITPSILRELGEFQGNVFDRVAIFEIIPRRDKSLSIPLELTWVGSNLDEFNEYQQKLRDLLLQGDRELYTYLQELIKDYWKRTTLIPIQNIESHRQLASLTERELAAENPMLYSMTAEFKLTEKYSNYGKITGKKQKLSSNLSSKEIEAAINQLKKDIELEP